LYSICAEQNFTLEIGAVAPARRAERD